MARVGTQRRWRVRAHNFLAVNCGTHRDMLANWHLQGTIFWQMKAVQRSVVRINNFLRQSERSEIRLAKQRFYPDAYETIEASLPL